LRVTFPAPAAKVRLVRGSACAADDVGCGALDELVPLGRGEPDASVEDEGAAPGPDAAPEAELEWIVQSRPPSPTRAARTAALTLTFVQMLSLGCGSVIGRRVSNSSTRVR
jgi:hypothetical protein